MRLPSKKIGPWAMEIIDECTVSRADRINAGSYWSSYYYSGTNDSSAALYNKCYPHVDRLASYLFSPPDVRFAIEFDSTAMPEHLLRAQTASSFLDRRFHNQGVDLVFGQGVDWALIKGSSFLKINWGHRGFEPWLVQMEMMGVLREDIDGPDGLDRQEAFVHTQYLTPGQMRRRLGDRPDADDLMKAIMASVSVDLDAPREDSYLHQIVLGGTQPVGTQPPGAPQNGMVSVVGGPVPQLAASVAVELIRLDELWVQDTKRQDWTTIQIANTTVVIEGELKRQNLFIKGQQPFTQICCNPTKGYFWGRSELANVTLLQNTLNQRTNDINRLLQLRVDQPMAFIGFEGMTKERLRALKARGGYIAESNPNAKIERLAPELPPDALEQVNAVVSWFDDVAGFTPIMTGAGDPGVRAGIHADTLVRTSTPRLRDRALLIERQCAKVGELCLRLEQVKNPRIFKTDDGQEFLLSQLPDDYRVTVDSHSASPAFSEDEKELAFALHRAGAIDNESLIVLTHPPRQDMLLAAARRRAEQEAQMIKDNPELLTGKKKK